MNNQLWKVKRELKRIARNSKDLAREMVRKIYFRRYYDYVTSKKIRRTVGSVPLGEDVAIYLIFPSTGLLDSHIYMLSALRNAGISSIVVSNFALKAQDRDKLLQYATEIIERQNTGYDFGGYRDGILGISDRFAKLERVWLFNDSVWLMPQDRSWFEQARSLNKDFVAATSSFSIFRKSGLRTKHVEPEKYRSIIWMHQPHNPNFHYASYALCIGAAILRDPRFLTYWKKLEIRNDKKLTVRRGEIGLTQWVLKHRYSHAATHEIDDLDQELMALDDVELDYTAREVILLDDRQMVPVKKQVLETDANSPEGRAERIGLILTATARRGTAYALALHNLRRHHFPFLKKSPLWLSAEGPNRIVEYVSSLKGQEVAHIAEEARMLCKDKASVYNSG
ncbi:rhamnan synthesis F family protein [Seohaeicola sp. SP36]|uniref:rhamnan synthesis F family protein n=1 Tax=Seohaeicola sp. SP36 TaxID=3028380 RepID=UPI00237A5FA7|nr:rhamnan synthesis F family protein [Seohaeicola sp. SP36]MDD9737956.1 rhamnan synthesis F family protein [Seohaeicola sp. SP36]